MSLARVPAMKRKPVTKQQRPRRTPKGVDQRKLGRNPATEPPKAKRTDNL
jgi:hypothetical protein